jgi:hypothetical protein
MTGGWPSGCRPVDYDTFETTLRGPSRRLTRCKYSMFAYLDAGTGSMIAGAVAAGAAGVATVGRMAWYKVSPKKRRSDSGKAEGDVDAVDDSGAAADESVADAEAESAPTTEPVSEA